MKYFWDMMTMWSKVYFHSIADLCIREAYDQRMPSRDSKLIVFVKDYTVKVRLFLEFRVTVSN